MIKSWTIVHLLYKDYKHDIKSFAKKRGIDSLIHLTRMHSEGIGMSFGLEKNSTKEKERQYDWWSESAIRT